MSLVRFRFWALTEIITAKKVIISVFLKSKIIKMTKERFVMTEKKAGRNQTIDTTLSEGGRYLNRCLHISEPITDITQVLDHTLQGTMEDVTVWLPKESVDLMIVDPPYNLTKEFHGNTFAKKRETDYEQYTRRWLDLTAPLLKKNGSVYVCCDWQTSLIIGRILPEYFTVRNRITWQREKGRGAKANWKNSMEDIFFATVSNEYTFNLDAVKVRKKVLAPYKENGKPKDWERTEKGNFRNTCPSNFWDDISVPYWSMPENTAHPTQKPEKLIAKLILASSDKDDLVLDPFAGSGTTAVVAKKLGRNYIGIEKNPLYCAWAEYRLDKAENDKSIQGYKNGVFWERNSEPSE